MTVDPPFRVLSPLEQAICHVDTRIDHLEAIMAATKADLEAALSRLQTVVSGKVDALSASLAGMQQTLNQFVADDATEDARYQAQIDDLKRQLASQLDDAVAAVNALTDAVGGTPA